MKILFVCTGNTCRSIMAEIMFKEKLLNILGEKYEEKFSVGSAGIVADGISSISKNALVVLEDFYKKSFDIMDRKCKLFDGKMIDYYDMILTVTDRHKEFILNNFDCKGKKVFSLCEFVDEGGEIGDPFMGNVEIYKNTFDRLDFLLNKLIDKLNIFGG